MSQNDLNHNAHLNSNSDVNAIDNPNPSQLVTLISEQPIDAYQLLQAVAIKSPKVGAQATFIGYMRDYRADEATTEMEIIQYPPMTERFLKVLGRETMEKYALSQLIVAHRVGKVVPTDVLVVISAYAGHRANALQATESLLELLKHNVPLWKKETVNDTSKWVLENTSNTLQSNS